MTSNSDLFSDNYFIEVGSQSEEFIVALFNSIHIINLKVNGSGWIKQYPKIDDDIGDLGDILEEEEEEGDDEDEEQGGTGLSYPFKIVPTPTDGRSESGESTSLLFADEADSNV